MVSRSVAIAACWALLAGQALADIYVVDGDTIIVDRERIRIVGIDAPEIGHAQCELELKRGLEAKAFLLTMIVDACGPLARASASCLDIARLPKPDRYGRTLAGISVGGRDVASEMISAGHARPYVCPGGRCAARKPWCGRRG
jgi:endonuclease YncB( thermonuclease family)